jgi:hypothetical protein
MKPKETKHRIFAEITDALYWSPLGMDSMLGEANAT